MAWSNSKVFAYAVLQMGTTGNVSPSSQSFKVALYGGTSYTPDNTVSTAVLTEYNGSGSVWVTANEVSSSGYGAGGIAVTPISWAQASNVITFSSSGAPSWGSPTPVSFTAYGGLVYNASVSNEGFCYNYFGGAQTVTSGVFTINWSGSGIATFSA